jgi:L-lactate dehydrogenase complex protein LldE
VRVALYVTCLNNALYPATGRAVVTLLERLGHQVLFPEPQTCCGQLHLNAGYRPEGLALARSVIETFADAEVVVVPSASCAATMRHLWSDAAEDEGDYGLAADAKRFAPRVHELSELLVDVLGVTDVGATYPHRVTYHPTCHSLRSLRVGDRPLQLLRAVRGLELVELPKADSCCGFGGLFAVKNAETSTAMGVDKLTATTTTGADVLCAADNSCLAHLSGLMAAGTVPARRPGASPLRFVHLAEILASTESDTTRAPGVAS